MASEIIKHKLVPEHTKLKEKERKELLEGLSIEFIQLPKILKGDPAIAHLDAKPGDVIRIKRPSITAKESIFYRGVAQ